MSYRKTFEKKARQKHLRGEAKDKYIEENVARLEGRAVTPKEEKPRYAVGTHGEGGTLETLETKKNTAVPGIVSGKVKSVVPKKPKSKKKKKKKE